MWTEFMDMHSGGGQKEKWSHLFIEASIDQAKVIFYNRFGHNPDRVTCTCCGSDYSISEYATLLEATAYERGCEFVEVRGEKGGGHYVDEPNKGKYSFNKYATLEQYSNREDVSIIYAKDIKDDERVGDIPDQGYVWVG
jgi:hypothetical protein